MKKTVPNMDTDSVLFSNVSTGTMTGSERRAASTSASQHSKSSTTNPLSTPTVLEKEMETPCSVKFFGLNHFCVSTSCGNRSNRTSLSKVLLTRFKPNSSKRTVSTPAKFDLTLHPIKPFGLFEKFI